MSDIPEYVTRAAEKRGLGQLVVWRKASNPFGVFVFFGGIAVGGALLLYGVLWLLMHAVDQLDTDLGAVIIVAGIALVGSAVLAVYGLARGFVAHYVFERGAIQTHNRRVDVATWDQLDEITQHWTGIRERKVTSIWFRMFDGRRWTIEAVTTGDQKDRDAPLVGTFIEAARRLGRPITHRPREGERPGEGEVPPRWKVGILVVALFAVAFFVSRWLEASGVYEGLALALGFLVAGLGTWVLGQAVRWLRVGGWVFAGIGGLILIGTAQRLLPSINGWVLGFGVLGLELLAVWGLGRVNAAMMPLVGGVTRLLYAATHRWRYRPSQHIALPSPATAARLLSVPPGSTSARGRSVVTFTIDGRQVAVFERVRRRPRVDDRPQTVWLVQLPAPMRYQEFQDGSWIDGAALWYAQESLYRTGMSPGRVAAVARQLAARVGAPTAASAA
jgi:hypothetical protein